MWPEDALEKVAQYFIQTMDIPEAIADSCVVICKEFHTTVTDASTRY